ncbi:hypothetical protein Tco_1329719 [Tanacetum coccineum]
MNGHDSAQGIKFGGTSTTMVDPKDQLQTSPSIAAGLETLSLSLIKSFTSQLHWENRYPNLIDLTYLSFAYLINGLRNEW